MAKTLNGQSTDEAIAVARRAGKPEKVASAAAKGKTKVESWSDDPGREAKDNAHVETVPIGAKPIVLPALQEHRIEIMLIGDEPLISHKWSEKAKAMLLGKQTGEATAGREKKDPQRDYEDSLYLIKAAPAGKPFEDGTFGFPAIAFKNAAVSACTSLGKAVTKVQARQAFHVIGNLIPIEGKPRKREDMVRVGMGTADIRFRGEFLEWAVRFTVRYNARVLTEQQIVNLFQTAGFAVGVGEWRPECNGNNGMFRVGGTRRLDDAA